MQIVFLSMRIMAWSFSWFPCSCRNTAFSQLFYNSVFPDLTIGFPVYVRWDGVSIGICDYNSLLLYFDLRFLFEFLCSPLPAKIAPKFDLSSGSWTDMTHLVATLGVFILFFSPDNFEMCFFFLVGFLLCFVFIIQNY